MPPLSACLLRRVLGPWSKPSSWQPIRNRAARPLASVPSFALVTKSPVAALLACTKGSSCFTSIVRKVAACSSRISRSCFKARRDRISCICFCVWVRLPLVRVEGASVSVAIASGVPGACVKAQFCISRSNGNTVRKCSSNIVTDSKR